MPQKDTSSAIAALLGVGLGNMYMGYQAKSNLENEALTRKKEEDEKRKQNFLDKVYQYHLGVYSDPNVPMPTRKESGDFLNTVTEQILGPAGTHTPQAQVPGMGMLDTGPERRLSYFRTPEASPKPELEYPAGFDMWPTAAKEKWLRQSGMVAGDAQTALDKLKEDKYRSDISLTEEKILTEREKRKDRPGDTIPPDAKLQLNAFKEKNSILKAELSDYYDKDLGGYLPEHQDRVDEILAELAWNSDKISEISGIDPYDKHADKAEKYYQTMMNKGYTDEQSYYLTKMYLSYIEAGIPEEQAQLMIQRRLKK